MNKTLGDYFLLDAKEFLIRYQKMKGRSTHLGNRSKLLVDLMFATECLLKANIFYESNLPEDETYRKIQTHKISKLFNKLSEKSKKQFDRCLLEDLSKYDVAIRYQLESEIYFRNDIGVLGNKYYKSIVDLNWFDKLYEEIDYYHQYVKTLNPVQLKLMHSLEINLEKIIQEFKVLKQLGKKDHTKKKVNK
jgi:hypothetical protein